MYKVKLYFNEQLLFLIFLHYISYFIIHFYYYYYDACIKINNDIITIIYRYKYD